MNNIEQITCKTCGGMLDPITAVDGVLKCAYCGNVWTVPKPNTDSRALGFLQMGEHDLDTCKFDDAYAAYQKAAELEPEEPEAYFGMALAEFKVQQIKARKTDAGDSENAYRLQPICHIGLESTLESKRFGKNANYLKALTLATAAQRELYERKCEEIEHIRSEFLNLRKKGIEYDCFICVKVTIPGTKEHTSDYKIADDIYTDLRRKGYKPFFSERELDTQTGSDYEAYILYALYCSECMLVVCGNEDYLKTPWVKNEYTRFMSMIADETKERDSIAIVYKGAPIEHLPGKSGKLQGINIDSLNAVNRIREYVDAHSPEGKKRREEEQRKRAEEEEKKAEAERKIREEQEQLRKKFEEQNKMFEEQNKMFEERLRNIRSDSSAPQAASGMATVNSLIVRARQFLASGDNGQATTYFNRALDAEPESGEAWWGLFLIDMGLKDEKEIAKSMTTAFADKVQANRNFQSALTYSSESFTKAKELDGIINSPSTWWDKFLADMKASSDNDVINSVTHASLKEINANINYARAKKLASGEFKKRIAGFDAALDAAPAHWRLFLEDMNVSNESALVGSVSDDVRDSVEKNAHYKTALRKADGDMQKRIDSFQNAFYSGELWWKKFLGDMNASNEDEILKGLTIPVKQTIVKNQYYVGACKYAQGELLERINSFRSKLNGGEFWWKRFLETRGGEEKMLAARSGDKLKDIFADPLLKEAEKYADESTQAKIKAFYDKFNDSSIWFESFLNRYNAKSLDEIAGKVASVKTVKAILKDELLAKAKQYAGGGQKRQIEDFEGKINELLAHYDSAQQYWGKLIREIGGEGAKGEKSMNAGIQRIDTSENYAKAIEEITLSKDAAELKRMQNFAARQGDMAEKNLAAKNEKDYARMAKLKADKRKVRAVKAFKVTEIVVLVCCVAYIAVAFLGIAKVKPFYELLAIWGRKCFHSSSGAESANMLWTFTSFAMIGFGIAHIMLKVKGKDKERYLTFAILAILLIPLAGTFIGYNASAHMSGSNFLYTDEYVFEFNEVDGGYALVYSLSRDTRQGGVTLEIPSEFKGKPVVQIGKYADKDSSPFGDIENEIIICIVPDSVLIINNLDISNGQVEYRGMKNVTTLGSYAFEGISAESLTVPSGVTVLPENSFSLATIGDLYIGKNVTVIEQNAFRRSNIKKLHYEGTREEWTKNVQYGPQEDAHIDVYCSDEEPKA